MALKHEAVIEHWNQIIENGAGHATTVMGNVEMFISESRMPGVSIKQEEVSSGLFGAKRTFLVVTHSGLRDYKMYISARDYGKHLDVSWYLTVEPRFLKRAISKYTLGNPQALSMQVDFFSQQDMSACIGYAHHCVTQAVKEVLQELGKEPSSLNTKSKGFLELW